MITSVSSLPDCRTISASPRSPSAAIQLRPIFTCSYQGNQTLARASHLISIGPDQACLEVSEPPPSCTPISHTSGTISKEQAPFTTDCLLSCLPAHGPPRIGFRLLLRHTSLSDHASRSSMVQDWCVCPKAARAVTAPSPSTRSLLAPAGSPRSRPGPNPGKRPLLTQPRASPFGRCWPSRLATYYIDQPNGIRAQPPGMRTVSRAVLITQPSALPAAQPTRVGQRRALPNVHPPHGQSRDLPLAGSHCDARPAFAASEICLISMTPILCSLIPSDFR